MSLAQRVSDLATRVATEAKTLRSLINGGASDLTALTTSAKNSLVAAINETVLNGTSFAAGFWYSGSVNVTAYTTTQVPIASSSFNDRPSQYSLASGAVTISKAGLYLVSFFMLYDSTGSAGTRTALIRLNGTSVAETSTYANGTEARLGAARVLRLAAGDVIDLCGYTESATKIVGNSSRDTGVTITQLVSKSDAGAMPPDVQIFTASGTWTKPSYCTFVQVTCVSGGGGGGAGRRGPSGTAQGGGGGGGAGGVSSVTFAAANVPATVGVGVGAGGAGGAAQTTDSTNGAAGSNGGVSAFGSYARAGNGNGGGSGASASASGGSGGAAATTAGGSGNIGGFGVAGGSSAQGYTPIGGGGGGGLTATPATTAGGQGGAALMTTTNNSSAGAAGGGNGGNGASGLLHGQGGGGGGSSTTTAGGAGGSGGLYGGGGGGGAASLNGYASGAGGKGGDGVVIVVSW